MLNRGYLHNQTSRGKPRSVAIRDNGRSENIDNSMLEAHTINLINLIEQTIKEDAIKFNNIDLVNSEETIIQSLKIYIKYLNDIRNINYYKLSPNTQKKYIELEEKLDERITTFHKLKMEIDIIESQINDRVKIVLDNTYYMLFAINKDNINDYNIDYYITEIETILIDYDFIIKKPIYENRRELLVRYLAILKELKNSINVNNVVYMGGKKPSKKPPQKPSKKPPQKLK